MQTNIVDFAVDRRTSWYRRFIQEVSLSWTFIAGDISSTIIPALLFLTAAWHSQSSPMLAWVAAAARGFVYFWLYIYIFCLSNQIAGLEEDRVNKPHRPLVCGAVSVAGAWQRWLWSMGAFTVVGWMFGVLPWALLWQAITVLHNFGGCAKRWYGKNFMMALGIIAELGAAWALVQPVTPLAWRWILAIAAIIFVLVSAQDLRDMEGDRRIGRRTAPIVFGEQPTRIGLAVGFAVLPFVVHGWLIMPLGLTTGAIICDVLLAVISFIISGRLVLLRSRRADHHTYLLLTYWYCMVLFSAIVVM